MSSMSLSKSDWEDWNFIYRKILYATISSPSCPDTFWLQPGVKKEWDLKIELFTEIMSDSLSYEDSIDIVEELFQLTFNYTHGQTMTLSEFSGLSPKDPSIISEDLKMSFKNTLEALCLEMGFLLLDDPKEALDYAKGASEKARKYPIKNFLRCMLINAKENGVRNWHLKLLCAFVFVISEFHKYDYPLAKLEDDESVSLDLIAAPIVQKLFGQKSVHLLNDYFFWCRKVIGKENALLCTYRCQLYKIFKATNSKDAIRLLTFAYESNNEGNVDPKVALAIQTGRMHTLHALLHLISEGYLSRPDDVLGLLEQSAIPMNTKVYFDSIKSSDYPVQKKIREKIKYVTAPAIGEYLVKGACLIINQLHQYDPDETKRRHGTVKDEEKLILTMSKLGCEDNITVKRDLTSDEIKKSLLQFKDHLVETTPDFCVVVILSHGRQNPKGQEEIMGIDWKGVSFSTIKNIFVDGRKCPVMIGKSKLFFVQACRGAHENQTQSSGTGHDFVLSNETGIVNKIADLVNFMIACYGKCFAHCLRSSVDYDSDGSENENDEPDRHQTAQKGCPNKSWYFIHHSTIKGYKSYRKGESGSIFIQELCKTFDERGTIYDLGTLASYVNRNIMEQYQVQAPEIVNQLGNFVFFQGERYQEKYGLGLRSLIDAGFRVQKVPNESSIIPSLNVYQVTGTDYNNPSPVFRNKDLMFHTCVLSRCDIGEQGRIMRNRWSEKGLCTHAFIFINGDILLWRNPKIEMGQMAGPYNKYALEVLIEDDSHRASKEQIDSLHKWIQYHNSNDDSIEVTNLLTHSEARGSGRNGQIDNIDTMRKQMGLSDSRLS